MIISDANHKVFLYKLFLDENGIEKPVPLAQLNDASSVMKKLKAGASQVPNVGFQFSDDSQEFTIDEAKLLKDMLASLKTAKPSELDLIEQLKAILV